MAEYWTLKYTNPAFLSHDVEIKRKQNWYKNSKCEQEDANPN